jgi:hypothetical protein
MSALSKRGLSSTARLRLAAASAGRPENNHVKPRSRCARGLFASSCTISRNSGIASAHLPAAECCLPARDSACSLSLRTADDGDRGPSLEVRGARPWLGSSACIFGRCRTGRGRCGRLFWRDDSIARRLSVATGHDQLRARDVSRGLWLHRSARLVARSSNERD